MIIKIFRKLNIQYSKIVGCGLQRQGNLPFDFAYGSCGDYTLNGEDLVLLCFSSSDTKKCHRLYIEYLIITYKYLYIIYKT